MADKLDIFIPHNEFGFIKPVSAESTKGCGRKKPLNLSVNALETRGRSFGPREAFREILQNLIDGVVQANDDSYNGLDVTVNEQNGSTYFHTDKNLFGMVTETDDKIVFTNYGPYIESIDQVIQFGASKKTASRNQVGQHGEGLNRAALRFLLMGFKVNVTVPVFQEGTRHARVWKLTFTTEKGELMLTRTPRTAEKKALGPHRFEVLISKGTTLGGPKRYFDIREHMIRNTKLLHAPNCGPRVGSLLDPGERGNLYVWHFFVCKTKHALYGYDLLNVDYISRDRDWVDGEDAVRGIAAIWSHAILTNTQWRDVFLKNVFLNFKLSDTIYEKQAIAELDPEALKVLLVASTKENQTCCRRSVDDSPKDLRPEYFVPLPSMSYDAVNRRFPFEAWVTNARSFFKSLNHHPIDIQGVLLDALGRQGIKKISVVFGYNGPCKWYLDNGHLLVSDSILEHGCCALGGTVVKWNAGPLFQTLLFDVFPHIGVDPKPIYRAIPTGSVVVAPPPPAGGATTVVRISNAAPAPAAPAPAPAPAPAAAAPQQVPRKRGDPPIELTDEPPKRYKPYTGPTLYVFE